MKTIRNITVTKQFSFCYGHYLPEYKGKCATQHGHNSILEVEIGVADGADIEGAYPGMVMDFSALKKLVERSVIDKLDHKFLNKEDNLPFQNCPTAEEIVYWIVQVLQVNLTYYAPTGWAGRQLERVRLTETPTSWAEWRRER